jgi:hypothetical protein
MDLKLDITGTAPLLMHNARLSNPLDELARAMKKVSAKRSKSEDDYLELARLEFLGGLYNGPVGPYIPADNIFRCLVDAGRKRKLGVKVTSGVIITTDENPLAYKGPREPDELWRDGNFMLQASAKVGQQRIIRTRPKFPVDPKNSDNSWRTSAMLYLDTEVLDYDDLTQLVDIAGRLIGLGDWRPRYGRFEGTLTVVKDVS